MLGCRGHTIEQWYPLSPADKVAEVRGEVYLELYLAHRGTESPKQQHQQNQSSNSSKPIKTSSPYELHVTVVEARGLPSRSFDSEQLADLENGKNSKNDSKKDKDEILANPCVRVCVQVEGETSLVETTSTVCMNTLCPKWTASTFQFELAENDDGTWDDTATLFLTMVDVLDDGMERFLGEVTIPLIELDVNRPIGAWYSLFPRQDAESLAVTAAATASALSGISDVELLKKAVPKPFSFAASNEGDTRASFIFSQPHQITDSESSKNGASTGAASGAQANKKSKKLGAIRLKIKYEEDDVLPVSQYDPLLKMLLYSLTGPDALATGAISLLEDVMSDREDAARALVKIFLDQELITSLLNALTSREIKSVVQTTTLFRGNSLATKSVEQFMKISALPYLHATLKDVVTAVFEEQLSCEIDPSKLPKGQDINTNAYNLRAYMSRLLDAISSSVDACPLAVRQVYKHLQDRVLERFADDKAFVHLRYVVVSGFLFLRFFSPAILAPKAYGLSEVHPNASTTRTLTLIAKTLQNLGNLGQRAGNTKEQYMSSMDSFIIENVSRVRSYIDHLTAVNGAVEFANENSSHRARNSMISKEGDLLKHFKKSGVFGADRDMFIKRTFKLDDRALTYYNADAEVAGRIKAEDIVAVEKVDQSAFGKKFVIQIVSSNRRHADQTLYFAAEDVNDQNEWLSALRNFGGRNPNTRQHYHPGAFKNGKWTCCKLTDSAAEGCNKTHPVTASMDIRNSSVSRELHRLYRQFALGLPKLVDTYIKSPALVASSNGNVNAASATGIDPILARKALSVRQLEVVIDDVVQFTGEV